jgi:DNA-binding GntR family transcriptional regulator
MSATGPRIDLRTSAAEAVTDQLRRELLAGTIAPGERILPKDVAERFSVSIVPVREALRRLEAEELVVSSPQRATYAADVGLEDLAGIYELRRIVEGELAQRAAGAATPDDVARCRRALDALAAAEPYAPAFFDAHRAFHRQLIAPAASNVARGILERLWLSVDRYLALAVTRLGGFGGPEQVEARMAEHRGLFAAYETGDAELLRDRLVAHLTQTEDALREAYRELLPDAPATARWLRRDS